MACEKTIVLIPDAEPTESPVEMFLEDARHCSTVANLVDDLGDDGTPISVHVPKAKKSELDFINNFCKMQSSNKRTPETDEAFLSQVLAAHNLGMWVNLLFAANFLSNEELVKLIAARFSSEIQLLEHPSDMMRCVHLFTEETDFVADEKIVEYASKNPWAAEHVETAKAVKRAYKDTLSGVTQNTGEGASGV